MLFESRLGSVVNVYYKLQGNHVKRLKKKKRHYQYAIKRQENKWNHIKCSVKTINGRKRVEDKIRGEKRTRATNRK